MMNMLGVIPAQLHHAFATLLYVLLYRIAGYRKGVVAENLKSVFGDGNAMELTVRTKSFYRHIATLLLEISRMPHMDAQAFRQRVRVNNPELAEQLSAGFTRPVLILSLHQGNWEWLLSGVAIALRQPLHVVYKPLHNAALDSHMRALRERFDCRAVQVAQVGRDLVAARREPRLLVMAADQAPVSTERQHKCDFLGRSTAFHAMPGELAARLKMPVLFARCHRTSPGHYRVDFEIIADGTEEVEGARITTRYAALAEAAIMAQPQTWLWSHRRWKPS